ncbi:unnamed protein product, partial [Effrenium voratum]
GLGRDVIAWSAGISACEKAGGRWQVALALLSQIESSGLELSSISVGAAISACEKAGQWQAACAVLDGFLLRALQLDTVPFSAAIAATARSAQWRAAQQLLREMDRRVLCKDTVACTAAISCFAAAGHWAEALEVLAAMDAPDIFTFSSALSACHLAGRWAEARSLLRQIDGRRLHADGMHVGCFLGAVQRATGAKAAFRELRRLRRTWPQEEAKSASGLELPCAPVISTSPGLVAVNKPSGALTEDVISALSRRLKLPTTTLSRLDVPTSGVLPVVIGSEVMSTAKWFKSQFAGRLVQKEYLCLCRGEEVSATSQQTISLPLRTGDEKPVRTSVHQQGREACTVWEVLEIFRPPQESGNGTEAVHLIRAEPKTGRMHQIRVHLASIGLPLVGDCSLPVV